MAKRKKAGKKKAPKGLWTKADINLLKKLFPNNPTSKIAAKLEEVFEVPWQGLSRRKDRCAVGAPTPPYGMIFYMSYPRMDMLVGAGAQVSGPGQEGQCTRSAKTSAG